MNAVGIDVSKGKSMVAILRPLGEVVQTPMEIKHNKMDLKQLADLILALEGDTKVIMEATGRYHESVASYLHECGIFVSVVNPIAIHNAGNGVSVRKTKTDRKDAIKIAKFGLDNWVDLREYTVMDTIRQQLKLFSRQYDLYMKTVVALENNLISMCEKTFPGVESLFSSPGRSDGHTKWVDFVVTFWHSDCVSNMSKNAFIKRYQKWCKRNRYNFSEKKATEIYQESINHITTLPKNENTKALIQIAAKELIAASENIAAIRKEMTRLAKQLPEYDVVRSMYGVGDTTAAQLMAEIGDIRNFKTRRSIVAFAGVDPAIDQSGKEDGKGKPSTKRGSPHLRKTLFQIMSTYIKTKPSDEPIYQFLDKKRTEGKPYYVYMSAGANKFLRIYFARVKECMAAIEPQSQEPSTDG